MKGYNDCMLSEKVDNEMVEQDICLEMDFKDTPILEAALAEYAAFIQADYHGSIEVEFARGKKYIKIITKSYNQRSVHSFICIQPHSFYKKNTSKKVEFKFGDILMAASWNAPARNFARGNVLDQKSYRLNVRWTGV